MQPFKLQLYPRRLAEPFIGQPEQKPLHGLNLNSGQEQATGQEQAANQTGWQQNEVLPSHFLSGSTRG
jgi:hypothetical protein